MRGLTFALMCLCSGCVISRANFKPAQAATAAEPAKQEAGKALAAKLEEVLNSENHKWYLDKMTPEEREQRRKRQEEFKARYEGQTAAATPAG